MEEWIDGIRYEGDAAVEAKKDIKTACIKEGTTVIGSECFEFCDDLISVVFPSSLRKIGCSAFFGSGAFNGCSALTEVKLSNRIVCMSDGILASCESLQSVRLPNDLQRIGSYAFAGCHSLTSNVI